MLQLYPEIKPYATHRLEVGSGHTLYVEESGDPEGLPVLFVHGGPGAGCDPKNRCFFDPEAYRIILFDQRGAGRSTPHAGLNDNTSTALVADMEAIREHLAVDRWLLFGGSWGSTLSLLYAQAHTERVIGMILRGIFLARQRDVHWLYQEGASRLFPDYWEDYLRPIPASQRGELVSAYYDLLTGDNELARMAAAKAWSGWEAHCATLRPNLEVYEHLVDPHVALALARIEAHFFVNDCFIRENQIIEDAGVLAGVPGVIVHGRYDAVCPLDNAFALHQAWPESELHIIRDAGHVASEPGITDALIRATRRMAQRFRPQPEPA
ncbi:MAG: prolyl aminopeptidase [Halieaceae bacterium]|jgi:proline iminopeptidase|nr:prolyl aminopeptidase [Halieaceae bacterium]